MPEATAPPFPNTERTIPTGMAAAIDLPPTYEDSANPNSMPPTYESLYGEFQQVEDPKGLAQFMAKAFAVIISTMTAAVVLALLNIIPLGMIVLGTSNLHRCPVEPYIPIWLVVTGLFLLIKSAINFYYRAQRRREGRPPSAADINPNPFDGLLSCFLIVWFIIGSVWVYSVYDDLQYSDPKQNDYCDQFTYIFSIGLITLGYALLFCTLCCFCCCCCCICCRPRRRNITV